VASAREPGWAPTALDTFRTIARNTIILDVVLAVLGAVIGFVAVGSEAAVGVAVGVGIAALGTLMTVAVMIATERWGSGNELGSMLASYILKMMLMLVLLAIATQLDFLHKSAVILGFIAAVIGSLVVDMWTIARTRA